jgi:hypothetical protein
MWLLIAWGPNNLAELEGLMDEPVLFPCLTSLKLMALAWPESSRLM